MKSKPRSTIKNHENTNTRTIGRRAFLKLAGSAALAAVIYGCGGNPARVAPTASPTATPQPTGTATATPQPTATATITPTPTPSVPEWATDHLKKHNAWLEVAAGGEYFYTATKEVTTRSGEKRVIDVRMLEYNKDTKEWIPCYQTAADLLKKEQLQTLFALNNITKPEEAVWLVRPDVAKGTEDLIKVADIFDAYAATKTPSLKCWPFRIFSDRDPHGANVMGANGGEGIHGDERWEAVENTFDGVTTRDPRGWLMMRRGSNQQVVAGFMTMEKPGMIFAGFDNLVFTAKTKTLWGHVETLADALGKFSNPSGDICRLAGMVLTPEYTQYCADQQTAWKQVQAYWSGLPAADQKYMAEMAALNKPTPESDPNCPWMARLRGLIVWFDNAVSSQNYKSA